MKRKGTFFLEFSIFALIFLLEAQLKLVAQLRDELRVKTIKNQMLKFLVGMEPGDIPIDHDVAEENLFETDFQLNLIN